MTDTRHRTSLGSTFRFGVRLLGLLGLAAAVAGGVIAAVFAPQVLTAEFWTTAVESVKPLGDGSAGTLTQVGVIMALAGGGLAVLWAVVELLGGLFLVTGRKSAEGAATLFLGVLAVAVVVVLNWVSNEFYARIDCTRDQRFTLARPLVDDLKRLDPTTPTTVLVLQRNKTSVYDADNPDALTAAAQQKVTEKVLDLIDELRQHPELSARFDVRVLAPGEKFEEQLAEATRGKPELRAAVEAAPESSIFFAANGRVRRMPFAHFYLLDKTASRGKEAVGEKADPAAANLVLTPQGKERFVRALVGLEQRKPKVGLLTIHPLLTSRNTDDDGAAQFTASGLRAALERDGCEVADVVLKKGWDAGSGLSPSAGTFEESKLEEIEAEYLAASEAALEAEIELKNLELVRERVKTAPIAEVERMIRGVTRGPRSEAEFREFILTRLVEPSVRQLRSDADEAKKRTAELEPEYRKLLGDDRVQADRRTADVYAKLKAAVADCDLLVVPRFTTMSLVNGQVISASLYPLAKAQTDVVKEFMAAGKPVLFAFGPAAGSNRGFGGTTDENETLLQRLGIEFGTQTVVTTAEALAMKKPGSFGDRSVKLPTLEVARNGNPVAAAFDRANRTVDGTLELKRSGYRPIYLAPRDKPFPFPPEILLTTDDAWNEDRPVPESASRPGARPYFPKFDTSKPDDPKKGTREEERKQKFVVGVAAEVPVPAEWTDPQAAAVQAAAAVAGVADVGFGPGVASAVMTPDQFADHKSDKTVRVAVFGHGGLFVGKQLDPGQEALLVSTVNWQLRRDDSLPRDVPDDEKWKYPRVPLGDKERTLWQVGGWLGLPLAAALLGVVALLFRWRR